MLLKVNSKQYDFCLSIGLAITLVSLPFLFTHKVFFVANRLAILFITLLWLFNNDFAARLKTVGKNYLLVSFILMYFVEILGLFYSSNYVMAFSSLEKKLPLLLIPLIVLTSDDLRCKKLDMLLKCFVGSVTLASVVCLIQAVHRNNYFDVFTNPNWFYFSYSDLTEILGIQPIYFSVFVSFSFFVVVFHGKKDWSLGSRMRALLCFFLGGFLFVFLTMLSGRTAIAATLLILIAITFVFFQRRKRLLVGLLSVVSIVLVSGLLISQLPIVRERFLEALGMNKTSDWVYGDPQKTQPLPEARLIKWKAAFNIIQDNWLIGVSSGDAQDELNTQYGRLGFQAGMNEQFNTHNQFLQTWVGSGLTGLMIFAATLILGVVKSIKDKNHLYLVFIVIFCICCITESMLERQFGILIYVLLSSLFYSQSIEKVKMKFEN